MFVGYGIVEPASSDSKYDSYGDLDVSGKIVLALRYLPEDISSERRQGLSVYASRRYKAKVAADRGAIGFLLVTGPNSPEKGGLVTFSENDRTSGVSIPAGSITAEAANRMLADAGTNLKTLQTMLDAGETPVSARVSTDRSARLSVQLDRVRKECRNILAVLPPTGGTDEYVLAGGWM